MKRALGFTAALLLSVTAHADPQLKSFCALVQKSKASFGPGAQLQTLEDLLEAVIAPGRIAPPQIVSIPSESQVTLPSTQGPAGLRNVIFYAGASPWELAGESAAAAQQRLDAASAPLKKWRGAVKAMARAPGEEACAAVAGRYRFSATDYLGWLDASTALRAEKQITSQDQVVSLLRKAIHKKYLKWELQSYAEASDLLTALQSPGIGNVILITHATADGKLVDSDYNVLPLGFFNTLSPSIRSLSVFSCHDTEAVERYELKTVLAHGASIHAERELITPRTRKFMGSSDVTPLLAFPSFIAKVDRLLAYQADPADQGNGSESAKCAIRLSSGSTTQESTVTRGAYAWVLNGSVIGVAQPHSPAALYTFSCSLLKPAAGNVLISQDLALTDHSDVPFAGVKARLEMPEQPPVELDGRDFLRPDGSYENSKFVFTFLGR